MSSISYDKAEVPTTDVKAETQKQTLVVKCRVIIDTWSNSIFGRKRDSEKDSIVIQICEQIVCSQAEPLIIDETLKNVSSELQKEHPIHYKEHEYLTKSHTLSENLIKRLKSYAEQEDYDKIILKVYLLGYNDSSISQSVFINSLNYNLRNCDKRLKSKLNFEKSTIETLSLNDEMGSTPDQTSQKAKALPPIDAQISALMSHYVYYYLDYLEHILNTSGPVNYLRSKIESLTTTGNRSKELDDFKINIKELIESVNIKIKKEQQKAAVQNIKDKSQENKSSIINKFDNEIYQRKKDLATLDHTDKTDCNKERDKIKEEIARLKKEKNNRLKENEASRRDALNNLTDFRWYKIPYYILVGCIIGPPVLTATILKAVYNTPNSSGMIGIGNKKVRQRIVNRMYEVLDIVGEKDIESKLTLCMQETIERKLPYDFYEFYDKLGYWTYIDNKALQSEAKLWHTSTPLNILSRMKNDRNTEDDKPSRNESLFIQKTIKMSENQTINIYENTVLKSGISRVSGYGGALFVRVDKDTYNYSTTASSSPQSAIPTRFCYATKGTDFNSLNDWILVDVLQALTGISLQHLHTVKNAVTIYKAIEKSYPNCDLLFCGHSLGGGLASSNAISVPKCHAVTFNAAGLNFIGSMWTRVAGALGNFTIQTLRPLAVAERIHPIRIQNEAVDVLMIIAKLLTFNLNERAYGRNALEILNVNKSIGSKHGINNFLYKNIMNRLYIPQSGDGIRHISAIIATPNGTSENDAIKKEMPLSVNIKDSDTRIEYSLGDKTYVFRSTGKISLKDLDDHIKIVAEYLKRCS